MMKKMCSVWISLFILSILGSPMYAQTFDVGLQANLVPLPLLITYEKTTNLIFPYAIKSVDKGSKDVLVQIAKGVENILQLKAAKQDFAETNLTVVTADGKLYSFLLNYTQTPSILTIKIGNNINYPNVDALFTYKSDNEARVYDLTEQIRFKKPLLKHIVDSRFDVTLNLEGIYIKDDKFYFQFELLNNSNVDYSIEGLRFYIRDKKKSKRTATQEIELSPVQIAGNTEIIHGQSIQHFVVVLPRFTIPDKKLLHVQLMEQNGGRHLQLKVENKLVVNASTLR